MKTPGLLTSGSAVLLAGTLWCAGPAVAAEEEPSAVIWVDDFNRGESVNLLGGEAGAWIADPDDGSVYSTAGFSDRERLGDGGYSLRLAYDLESSRAQFAPTPTSRPGPEQSLAPVSKTSLGGYSTQLKVLDASEFSHLTFWVKGDVEEGYTRRFRLEIKDDNNLDGAWVEGIGPRWQKVSLPLKRFGGVKDWTRLNYIAFVFDGGVTQKTGAIYVDDVRFERHGT